MMDAAALKSISATLEAELASSLPGMQDIISGLGLADQFVAINGHKAKDHVGGSPKVAIDHQQRDTPQNQSHKRPLDTSSPRIKEESQRDSKGEQAGKWATWQDEELARAIMQISQNSLPKDENGSVSSSARGDVQVPMVSSVKRDKGLRSFSLKVCQKVEEKGVTTYAQVADDLVQEFKADDAVTFDEKNIRRRVYDALNVLMAIDIITKDKKHIRWKGFPQTPDKEKLALERSVEERKAEVSKKRRRVEEKAMQIIRMANLVERNINKEKALGDSIPQKPHVIRRVNVPFVIVKADCDNEIECEKSEDKQEALVSCTKAFELHDDVAVLERMNISVVTSEAELHRRLPHRPEVCELLLESNAGIVVPPSK